MVKRTCQALKVNTLDSMSFWREDRPVCVIVSDSVSYR